MKLRHLLFLAAAIPSLNAADWIKVTSANFTLYSANREDDARRTLETFEQTRDFFRQVKAFAVTSQLPFTLVDFGSESEYRNYTVGPFIPAYFTGDDEGDYIVMSDVGGQAKRVAVHEYVHSVVRHSSLRLPLWLNEGLAEVYSGMEARNGTVLLGQIPQDRAETLRSLRWMKLPDVIRITQKSPEFNERDKGGLFYAQSCLLAHMLMLGDGYAAKFSTFLETISATDSEQIAFSQVYGKSLNEIDRDMRSYFGTSAMGTASFHTETHRAATGPMAAATDVEIGLTLAKILAVTARPAEGMARLHLLAAKHKDNIDVAVAAAFLEWRIGEEDQALAHLRSIVGRPEAGWKAWWDYAQLLAADGSNRAAEMEALVKVVESKPDLAVARIRLGSLLLEAGKPAEALTQLKQIKEVASQDEGEMYVAMAYAALATGQAAQAKQYAEEAGKRPLRPDEQKRLQQILLWIERGVPASTEVRPTTLTDDDSGRPTLLRHKK
jgi:tetratricopeptide (TPR) repeat protein